MVKSHFLTFWHTNGFPVPPIPAVRSHICFLFHIERICAYLAPYPHPQFCTLSSSSWWGLPVKGKDKINLGCRSKDTLGALYRAGVLRFVLGCDAIWDSFRARHGWGCYRPGFSQDCCLPAARQVPFSLLSFCCSHKSVAQNSC